MNEAPEPIEEPSSLRFLRRLVTVLTGTMIAGLLTIIALLVIRFSDDPAPGFPDGITLPPGASAQAFTQGRDWYAIVTDDDQIVIYDRASGQIVKTVPVRP